ncbi:MAG: DNA polymerase I [Alphaproteobacteria bacterium]|nr:DNA polymerase I [Alphaproteobacteria bacterium]
MAANKKKSDAVGPLYLVDGSGFIFRAYHALPQLTRKRDKMPTGAVTGFCNMLNRLLTEIGPDGHLAVVFDAGRKTFRNDIYPDYKAHRPPPPDDLIPQFAMIREATKAFNVATVDRVGFEADDLIASYARAGRDAGFTVIIVSSDKDLMQLIEPGISMLDPLKNRSIGETEVREKFGVDPEKMIDLQALAGDSTDNVPGVPGIGVKTAAELLGIYGNLEQLLQRAEEIKQPKRRQNLIDHAGMARISRDLVTLRQDLPLDDGFDALEIQAPDPEVLFPFLEDLEFSSLLNRLRNGGTGAGTASPRPVPPAASAPASAATAKKSDGEVQPVAIVQDEADLAQRVSEAHLAGAVAIHVEGSSPDHMQADLVGLAFSYASGQSWYVPLAHGAGQQQETLDIDAAKPNEAPKQIPMEAAMGLIAPLLEDPGVLKIGHDIKGPVKLLARLGVTMAPVEDTMLLSFTLGGGRDGHGQADIAGRLLNATPVVRKDLLGAGKKAISFAMALLADGAKLAGEVADFTFRAHKILRAELVAESMVGGFETIERPLIPVLASMERNGIKVDQKALGSLSKDFEKRMGKLEAAIHKLAGRDFNVGSPKQLGEVLFDEMELPGGKRAKTGAWKTGAEVLEALADDGHDLPEKVLVWRQLAKLKNTYADTLGEQINPATGRVHTTYQMAGAATGRLASVEPNLQNIPVRSEEGRKIRQAFAAEKGSQLVSADYSQIELRLLAHMAGIDALKEAFASGVDIHALTASQVFGVPVKGMDPGVRRQAKAINFGIIYGISAFGLGRQLGIGRKDAAEYIAAYFERYPGIKDYMEDAKTYARDHGYVTTLFGRRVYIAGILDSNHSHRAFSERAAINAPLQGTAADIIKRAMVAMDRELGRSKLKAKMLLSVHDELLFEVPDKHVDALSALAKKVMEGVAQLDVPLTVETGVGKNWDDAH